ncbi:MAG: Maf family protein [Hyphomonadaceae bacterium]|jgi:septum formation protein|nr:Maf family protein [Hyphomonadaceae bacterium]
MTASPFSQSIPVILASTSPIRRQLLTGAGIAHEAVAPGVDEDAAKEGLRAAGASPRDQADALAELKALRVSARRPGLVIGCDQMMAFEGAALDKCATLDEARERLRSLRGRTHTLEGAAVIARDGVVLWRVVRTSRLTMRAFSDAFLDRYLEEHGEAALYSVGCYQLEGAGIQLFSAVEGDYFSILGLPLLDVLDFLRLHGAVAT